MKLTSAAQGAQRYQQLVIGCDELLDTFLLQLVVNLLQLDTEVGQTLHDAGCIGDGLIDAQLRLALFPVCRQGLWRCVLTVCGAIRGSTYFTAL